MALRSGYKGIKKLAAGLKWNRPGILAADDTALAKVFFPRSEQAVLCAKNVLYIPNQTVSEKGMTLALNDNVIEFSGQNTEASAWWIALTNARLPKGTFIFNGRESQNIVTNIQILKQSDNTLITQINLENDESQFTIEDDSINYKIYIRIIGSGNVNGIKAYLMCRLSTDPDSTFAPYAMTNRELTEKVAANVVDIKTDFKTALMSATGSTVTDVETAMLSTYGDLMILNSRINKAANTGINCNVSVPYSVLPKTRGTVYVGLNSPMGAGTASLGGGSLALRYTNSDGATYVDLTVFALMDKS